VSAFLAGLIGALAGLVIALIAQSREDFRARRAEIWRQQTERRERLRQDFKTALDIAYTIEIDTGMFEWVTPSSPRAKDPNYIKRRERIDQLYEAARDADVRLRLEGATEASEALNEVARQHGVFREGLRTLDDTNATTTPPDTRLSARNDMIEAHKAIQAITKDLGSKFATQLEQLTPPGPTTGLRTWLRGVWTWVRT
jgi:hypothetical protein